MKKLHPAQSQIASDPHRFRVVKAGRRFGKSVLSAYEMFACAVANDKARVPYYAPTRDDARDIMWGILQEVCGDAVVEKNEGRLELQVRNRYGTTSLIALYGWEAVQERKKGVGVKNNFIVLDEVSKYRNFIEGWHEVLRPTLTDLRGGAMFISTPNGFNHFYDLYNTQDDDDDYKSFTFTSYDNPFLPKDEIEKAKKELTEDRFAQEYMADFRKTEGLVYKDFDRVKHLFKELPPYVQVVKTFGGHDFGTNNPCASITIKKDHDARYWVTDEWYQTGKTDAQQADYVAALKWDECYPDPASASGILEMKNRGINVRDVVKGKDSIRNGINTIKELLKTNRLKIHESCKNLIWEFETYSYPEKKHGHNEDENPIKEGDHACFIKGTIVNGQKIEDIGVQTGIEDVYEYEVAGEKLTATKNHPVLTHRGVVNIDTLRYNDIIWKGKRLFMTVSSGLGIRTVIDGLKGITISALKRLMEARERDYIDTYGERLTVKSLRAIMFIIKTATLPAMSLVILSLCSVVNTLKDIGVQKSENGLKKILSMLSNVLLNGLKPQLVRSGGEKLDLITNSIYLTDPSSQGSAIYAVKSTGQKEMDRTGFAITTAVKRHYVGQEPVYNLRTKNGMYLANGIMVSNCDAIRYALMMDNQLSVRKVRPRYFQEPRTRGNIAL